MYVINISQTIEDYNNFLIFLISSFNLGLSSTDSLTVLGNKAPCVNDIGDKNTDNKSSNPFSP